LALTGSHHAASVSAGLRLRRLWSRLAAELGGADMLVQRLAGTVFLLRVASAILAYGSQVLLARWMGSFEFGIYVYVWTWVLLIGQPLDLGLGTAAQRFIPEYRESGAHDLLRGFLFGSRWLASALRPRSRSPAPSGCGCWRPGSTTIWWFRSISPASACRPTASPTPRTGSRAATTGSGSA
jgi:hypothetical protein